VRAFPTLGFSCRSDTSDSQEYCCRNVIQPGKDNDARDQRHGQATCAIAANKAVFLCGTVAIIF
jgi:hypothetical protein